MSIYQYIYLAGLLWGSVFALVGGGKPERWGAAIILCGMILSNVAAAHSGQLYITTDAWFFAVDACEAIALIVLACTADRYWPMWAAMFQLDAVLTEIVMLAHSTPPFSYGLALRLFALPLPLIVGGGTVRYRRRCRLRVAAT
ncbi:MAG: hypothetical protein J0I47_09235 [Sphingomonas sp.]|uniref:hypothetical protein n=1 Tax=Sphingomonas sp. TaxID=28214 RepID=UPI001AC66BC1|nr:hypothetical protein [Sphingomonas sp.]MBN8808402.1 hypothetical protein [Sphingomonas sp.]